MMAKPHTEIPHQSNQSTADFLEVLEKAGIYASHYYDSMTCSTSYPDWITPEMKQLVLKLEKNGYTQASWSPFYINQYRILTHPKNGRVLITPDVIPFHAGYEIRSNGNDMDVAGAALCRSQLFTSCHIHQSFTRKVADDSGLLIEFELFQHKRDTSFFMLIDWGNNPPMF